MPKSVQAAFSFDLADGYFHFRLHPEMRKYFTFNINSEYFECISIPFGWNWSPTIFTKCMRPVITFIRTP